MAGVMAIITEMAMAFAILHLCTDMNGLMAAQKLDGDYSQSVQNCNFIWGRPLTTDGHRLTQMTGDAGWV
jgi:hypothetical protein